MVCRPLSRMRVLPSRSISICSRGSYVSTSAGLSGYLVAAFGSYVLQALAEHGLLDQGLCVRCMILPDQFIDQDTPVAMYARAGLDARAIVAKVFEALGKDVSVETTRLA